MGIIHIFIAFCCLIQFAVGWKSIMLNGSIKTHHEEKYIFVLKKPFHGPSGFCDRINKRNMIVYVERMG